MKMFGIRILNQSEAITCEYCGKEQAVFGVVKKSDLNDLQTNAVMSKRAAAEFLLWEIGNGELLCEMCLKERMAQHYREEK